MSEEFPKQNKVAKRGRATAMAVLLAAIVLAAVVVFLVGDIFGTGE